jgi:hypothetical protein
VEQLPLPAEQQAEPAFDEFQANWEQAVADAKAKGQPPRLMKVNGAAGASRGSRTQRPRAPPLAQGAGGPLEGHRCRLEVVQGGTATLQGVTGGLLHFAVYSLSSNIYSVAPVLEDPCVRQARRHVHPAA